ncbi:MAG: tRNA 2-thiouridine(34) synthase MnmA [Lachnospiraceae bacterium]|jgi:tRNA-specific 2-thiouridylase|nr:tRNA 2-thiouridine(34) synthase MnmA [Lachnospiraceae bacterium]
MTNKKVLIAMSGGVDSSVAAYLLKQQGYECAGATMKLFDNEDIGISGDSGCCSLEDTEDARAVAAALGIPFHVFNFSPDFKKEVIARFTEAYQNGATPNPCIDCNRYMKFEKLLGRARQLGMDYLATGHYARIGQNKDNGRYLLKKAVDKGKDQSYVLYSLTQEQLAHTLFPLGGLHKAEIRAIAAAQGFVNAAKRDSQDICFVPGGDYAAFIEQYTGQSFADGDYVDLQGRVLGRHKGLPRYTIGQRKGLGLALEKPLYVCAKNITDNTVTLCEDAELYSTTLEAVDFNWISGGCPDKPVRVKAKVRYKHAEQWATATPTSPTTVRLEFDEPQRAIAAGQAAVLYEGDVVVGGGTIV